MCFGRPLRTAVALGVACAAVAAGADAERDETLTSLRDQAAEIESAVRANTRPAWLDANAHPAAGAAGEGLGRKQMNRLAEDPPVLDACRDLGQACSSDGSATEQSAAVGQGTGPNRVAAKLGADDITITILASRSLGEAQLKELFALAAGSPRVQVTFRGVAEDESLMDFVRQMHGLLAGIEPAPAVVLDPRPFETPPVDIAPVLIASGPKGELARVAGLADPQWLLARVLAGARGDLGVRGPVLAVSEPDLITELKRRLAALDLGKLREQALARYWKQVGFETLPLAARARTRAIDPTITAAADLPLPDGTLLVRAGETLNLERAVNACAS
jgi:conjugal transfer pilus assembly protein TraW